MAARKASLPLYWVKMVVVEVMNDMKIVPAFKHIEHRPILHLTMRKVDRSKFPWHKCTFMAQLAT